MKSSICILLSCNYTNVNNINVSYVFYRRTKSIRTRIRYCWINMLFQIFQRQNKMCLTYLEVNIIRKYIIKSEVCIANKMVMKTLSLKNRDSFIHLEEFCRKKVRFFFWPTIITRNGHFIKLIKKWMDQYCSYIFRKLSLCNFIPTFFRVKQS